jgi:hypothetical protein
MTIIAGVITARQCSATSNVAAVSTAKPARSNILCARSRLGPAGAMSSTQGVTS